ncbi:MAG: endonuclease/exonuclease/phosphatase family protein [Phycisphaerales bacterium]
MESLRMIIRGLGIALGAVAIVTALLPMIHTGIWWIRVMDFPRLQFACIAFAALLFMIVTWSPGSLWQGIVIAGIAAVLVHQIWWIVPFTPLGKEQVQSAQRPDDPRVRLSVMVANVLQTNRDASAVLQQIRDHEPDVVVLLEIDAWWAEQLEQLSGFPHRLIRSQEDTYGMAVFSQLPISDAVVRNLVEEHIPSMHMNIELRDGTQVRFAGLHPAPPWPGLADDSRDRDAELVIVGRMMADAGPAVVAGDLNDVAWSHTSNLFQEVSDLLDPRRGRGMYNSFHAKWFFLRWPLDHVMHSADFRLISMQRLDHIGSDHFPVLIRLSYEPDGVVQQETPASDAEAEQEASEIIQESDDG